MPAVSAPPKGQPVLQALIAALEKADAKHFHARLSLKTDPLLETVGTVSSKTGGLLGQMRRPFQSSEERARDAKEALNYCIDKVEKGHSLSPDIQQEVLKQLRDLLKEPLGQGMPVKKPLLILKEMQQRQEQKYLDAAAHAKDMQANCEKWFEDQRAQPRQLDPAQLCHPVVLAHNAKTLSDAYGDYAAMASRGDLDADNKPTNRQLVALGHLATLLQILQSGIRDPKQPQAGSLQQVWASLPSPAGTIGIFTPARFSQHVRTQLSACTDALQALKSALANGDLNEARECCRGYVMSLEQLVGDLAGTANSLLDALAQNQLPPDLNAADKAFLLRLGESLLATVHALLEPGSPVLADYHTARDLLSKNDAQLAAVFQHWSPPLPGQAPPATLPALDLPPPASPRLPPFRRRSDEPLRAPNGRLNKTAVGYEIVKGKKLLKRLSTGDIPAIKAYKESLPDPENDPLFKPLSPPPQRPGTPRGPQPSTPEAELSNYLQDLEQLQSPLPSASQVMGDPTLKPLPSQSQAATEHKKPDAEMQDDLARLLDELEQRQFSPPSSTLANPDQGQSEPQKTAPPGGRSFEPGRVRAKRLESNQA